MYRTRSSTNLFTLIDTLLLDLNFFFLSVIRRASKEILNSLSLSKYYCNKMHHIFYAMAPCQCIIARTDTSYYLYWRFAIKSCPLSISTFRVLCGQIEFIDLYNMRRYSVSTYTYTYVNIDCFKISIFCLFELEFHSIMDIT